MPNIFAVLTVFAGWSKVTASITQSPWEEKDREKEQQDFLEKKQESFFKIRWFFSKV